MMGTERSNALRNRSVTCSGQSPRFWGFGWSGLHAGFCVAELDYAKVVLVYGLWCRGDGPLSLACECQGNLVLHH